MSCISIGHVNDTPPLSDENLKDLAFPDFESVTSFVGSKLVDSALAVLKLYVGPQSTAPAATAPLLGHQCHCQFFPERRSCLSSS